MECVKNPLSKNLRVCQRLKSQNILNNMWELFKDKNEYNEKNIIGFLSFALMCVFGIVDLAMGIIGIELMVNDYIYNSFVWVTLGSFGIAGAEKVYKK
tara:strand:- start:338 stop:631 length:294 start_codon:yes stop_codon:yes gene_type:complete